MVFASILDDFFNDFRMCFASPFRYLFFMYFWSFPNRFLNRANHEIIKNPLVFIGLFALGTFRTQPIFRRISIQKTSNFRIVFSWNSWLFRHRFSHRFFHRFLMENSSQKSSISSWRGEPFGDLFATFSEGRLLDAFWLSFGSLLAHFGFPFGSRWLTFGSRWLTFGSLWLPFGSLLVSLGSLLVPFPSLLLTQGSIFSLLLYPVLIFRIFLNFPWKYRAKSDSYIISFAFFKRLWLLGWSVWQRHADQKRQRERVNSNNRPNKFRKSHSRSFKSYFPEAHRTHPNRK